MDIHSYKSSGDLGIDDTFSSNNLLSSIDLDNELLKIASDEELKENTDTTSDEDLSEEIESGDSNESSEADIDELDDNDSASGDPDINNMLNDEKIVLPELDDVNLKAGVKGQSGDSNEMYGDKSFKHSDTQNELINNLLKTQNTDKDPTILKNNPMPNLFIPSQDRHLENEEQILSVKKKKKNTGNQSKQKRNKSKKKDELSKTSEDEKKQKEKAVKSSINSIYKSKIMYSSPEAVFPKEEFPTYEIDENGILENKTNVYSDNHTTSLEHIKNLHEIRKPPISHKSSDMLSSTKIQNCKAVNKKKDSSQSESDSIKQSPLDIEGTLKLHKQKKKNNLPIFYFAMFAIGVFILILCLML